MTNYERRVLQDVLARLSMESASFGWPPGETVTPSSTREPVEVTAFIRERTRIWRETWSMGPLRELLEDDDRRRKQE